MPLFDVVVEHEYNAQDEDELTLRVGTRIHVIKDEDEGWWQGELNGVVGMFPSNFVRKVEPVAAAAPPPQPAAPAKRVARVTHNYAAQDSDELTLCKGDLVTVISEIDEGWWQGELNGKVGLFPSNFVKEETGVEAASSTATTSSQGTTTASAAASVAKIKTMSAAISGSMNNVFSNLAKKKGEGEDKATTSAPNISSATAVATPPPSAAATLPTVQPSPAALNAAMVAKPPRAEPSKPADYLFKVKVMFDYPTSADDELTLKKNEVIFVLSLQDDQGWWSGQNEAGVKGVFPSNFVEEIPDSKPSPAKSVSDESSTTEQTAQPAQPAQPALKLPPGAVPMMGGLKLGGGVPLLKPRKVESDKDKETPPPTATDRPVTELFERKKFSKAPSSGGPVPATTDPASNELANKLKKRAEDAQPAEPPAVPPAAVPAVPPAPAPSTSAKPPKPSLVAKPPIAGNKPALATPPVPQSTALAPPILPAAAASVPVTPAIIVQTDQEESPHGVSLDDLPVSPGLSSLTKDRPRHSVARRPPQNRASSVNIFGEEMELHTAGGTTNAFIAPLSSSSVLKPTLPVSKPPMVTKPTTATGPPVSSSGQTNSNISSTPPPVAKFATGSKKRLIPGENATLQELRAWMIAEVEALHEELNEERQLRQALEARLDSRL